MLADDSRSKNRSGSRHEVDFRLVKFDGAADEWFT